MASCVAWALRKRARHATFRPAIVTMTHSALLRVVVFPHAAGGWSACALERDVRTSAINADAALDALVKMVEATSYPVADEPLIQFGLAPDDAWQTFAAAAQRNPPVELTSADSPSRLRYLVATRQ